MRKIAFVFPGQGSQYVGMGKEFYDNYAVSKEVFDKVDNRLKVSLSDICFNGPEEDLKLTVNTQPSILTTSVAILKVIEEQGIVADYVAGHSLGEYTALVAAGALNYEDAAWLVRQRGTFMQEAVPAGEGTMAAIIGLDKEKVEELCKDVAESGLVEPANFNCNGQIVVAGETKGIEKVVEIAKSYGAKRAVMLPVSGPFHSSLLEPASLKLAEAIKEVEISKGKIPIIANINTNIETNPEEIEKNLINQVSNAVLWQQSMEKLVENGVNTFIEIGPGKVLAGLMKKIDKSVEIYNVEDIKSLEETLAALKEV